MFGGALVWECGFATPAENARQLGMQKRQCCSLKCTTRWWSFVVVVDVVVSVVVDVVVVVVIVVVVVVVVVDVVVVVVVTANTASVSCVCVKCE